jgi:4-phytase / acid phosphatase
MIRLWWIPLLASATASLPILATAASPDAASAQLRCVVILSRHGVRAPLQTNATLDRYSAQPWPTWPVGLGLLTPHGQEGMAQMGAYYRARYLQAGLLSGDPANDERLLFVETDNDQRTILSGRTLGRSILAGQDPIVHALPAGANDPLFVANEEILTLADKQRAIGAILGRIGGDPETMRSAFGAVYRDFHDVLAGPPGAGLPAPQTNVLDGSTAITVGSGRDPIIFGSFFRIAESLIGNLNLEYTDGRPLAEVGWGRLTPERLAELTELQALYFDLSKRTFPLAQMEGSDLMAHILATLEQAATSQPVAGAFGGPAQRLIILNGHDDNVENIGGLLGISWAVPGVARNVSLPGGALVFELWQQPESGALSVRVAYISETIAQMRAGAQLSLDHPPFVAPIFIPECSTASPTDDAPFAAFERLSRRVIDPRFVVPLSP